MATYVIENCKLYVAQYDFSGDTNQVRLTAEVEEKEDTNFDSGGSREYLAGLRTSQAEHNGFVDLTDDGVDEILFDKVAAANTPMTICPTDGSDGEIAYALQSLVANYAPGESIGEVMAFTVTARGDGPLVRGTIMVAGAKTTTGAGTARQLGAVTATQKLYAVLHVVAASGTNPTLDVVVQSDDAEGMGSPTSRITFTQATVITSEWATPVDGAITDDWWQISYTIGGTNPSFTFLVVVGIQ